jgi:uncharacterized protein YjdB
VLPRYASRAASDEELAARFPGSFLREERMAYTFKLSRRLAQNGLWVALAAAACQSEPTSQQYDLSTIRISPQSTIVAPNGVVRYTATATTPAGDAVPVPVTWTASGGTIDADGNFLAGQLEGVFRVRAAHATQQWQGDSATAIVMSGPMPSALRIHPADVEVGPGVAAELMAWGIRASGDSMPLAAAFSATGGLLTPDSAGAIHVMPDGEAEIEVTGSVATLTAFATVRGSRIPVASVEVSPDSANLVVGGTTRLTATVRDAEGHLLPRRQLKWLTSNAAVATVSNNGQVVAKMGGTAEVGALVEGKSDRSLIRVGAPPPPVPVASVVVTPATASLLVGDTVRLMAVAQDLSGVSLTGRPFTWTSLNTQVVTVSNGKVTALKAGTAGVVASVEGYADTALVTVSSPTPDPVASVVVTPATASLTIGDTLRLTAVARDASGNVLSGRAFTWTSLSPLIAGVSSGKVTALAAGTAGVVATSEGRADTALISVLAVNPPDPAPWYELTFEAYSTTAELINDRGTGATFTNEDSSPDKIALVNDAPPGLGLAKSMRFTYDNPNPDGVMTVGRNVALPAQVSELWVEVYLKWSANFSTAGGTAPYDHKVLFGRYTPEVGRWEFKVGKDNGQNVAVGWPGGEGTTASGLNSYSDFWDGSWKRVRLHWKVGTGSNDGVYELWVGETLRYRNTAVNANSAGTGRIYGLALGRNQDNRDVSSLPMYLTWGRTRAWITNPGW